MKTNVKPSTIARIVALLVALVNQCLIIFGQDMLPFTANTAYNIVSSVVTIILVIVNAWYNNDFTKAAILSSKVLYALKDGRITEEELLSVLEAIKDKEESEKSETE